MAICIDFAGITVYVEETEMRRYIGGNRYEKAYA